MIPPFLAPRNLIPSPADDIETGGCPTAVLRLFSAPYRPKQHTVLQIGASLRRPGLVARRGCRGHPRALEPRPWVVDRPV